jgi:hypothetical protein
VQHYLTKAKSTEARLSAAPKVGSILDVALKPSKWRFPKTRPGLRLHIPPFRGLATWLFVSFPAGSRLETRGFALSEAWPESSAFVPASTIENRLLSVQTLLRVRKVNASRPSRAALPIAGGCRETTIKVGLRALRSFASLTIYDRWSGAATGEAGLPSFSSKTNHGRDAWPPRSQQ